MVLSILAMVLNWCDGFACHSDLSTEVIFSSVYSHELLTLQLFIHRPMILKHTYITFMFTTLTDQLWLSTWIDYLYVYTSTR